MSIQLVVHVRSTPGSHSGEDLFRALKQERICDQIELTSKTSKPGAMGVDPVASILISVASSVLADLIKRLVSFLIDQQKQNDVCLVEVKRSTMKVTLEFVPGNLPTPQAIT